MLFLLLSILVIVAQGLLGMADWWTLSSNWLLAGLINFLLAALFTNQHLISFNNRRYLIYSWVVMASILNLSAICLESEVEQGKQQLLVIGFASMLALSFTCWQQKDIPAKSLLLGIIIALLTLCYIPSLLWIVWLIIILSLLLCYSTHNLYCLLSGIVMGVWALYCLLFLFLGEEEADAYLLGFVNQWSDLTYDLPTFLYEGHTRWIFPLFLLGTIAVFLFINLMQSSMNSLRERSIYSSIGWITVPLLLLLPTDWALYLSLSAVLLSIHILLSLCNEHSLSSLRGYNLLVSLFLLLGAGEPLLSLLIDYIQTIDFSPLYSWWPWQ
jgi:hypothetical protein